MKHPSTLSSICISVAAAITVLAMTASVHAYQALPVPPLHVNGRFLQDPSGKNVLLHGYMQPGASWFNGQGANFTDPTDYTSTANVAGMLNYYMSVATIFSQTGAQYGYSHGWYCSYVRLLGNGTITGFAPGWDANGNLSNPAQFNGWINNVLIPYVNHCGSVGLYVILCGNPSEVYPGGDTTKNMTYQYQQNLITYWKTIAAIPAIRFAPNVMFEICNEPISIETNFGANNWGSGSTSYYSALKNFMQPIADAIRSVGSYNILLIPSLGWQGQSQGFTSYPVAGVNIAYSSHFYPGYGGVHDNTSLITSLFNSAVKPCADKYPLFITEMWWNPITIDGQYDDLWSASTSGFGNTVKSLIDNEGNIHWQVGMVGDLLGNLNSGLRATTLSSGQGATAAFSWWLQYTWAAPTWNGTWKVINRYSGKAYAHVNGFLPSGRNIEALT